MRVDEQKISNSTQRFALSGAAWSEDLFACSLKDENFKENLTVKLRST